MMSGCHWKSWTARPLALVAAVGIALTAALGVAAHLAPDPGMSPLTLTISDYAVSNNGWPMNVAILVLGVTSLAVPLALRAVRARVGAVVQGLLLVWSLGLIAAAIVPTDPIGVTELSTRGYVHRYVSVAAFVALPVATLLAIRRLAADVRWRGAVPRLRALAVTSVLALLGLYYVAFPGGRVMMGLVERILVVLELALLAVLVGRLHRLAGRTGPVAVAESVALVQPVAVAGPVALGEPVAVAEAVAVAGPVALGEPVAVAEAVAVAGPVALARPVRRGRVVPAQARVVPVQARLVATRSTSSR